MINDQDRDYIEIIIDQIGLNPFLEQVADICWTKASHIQANWQDNNLAQLWEQAGNRIIGLTCRIKV